MCILSFKSALYRKKQSALSFLQKSIINYTLTTIFLCKNYRMKEVNSKKAFEYYCKGLNSKEIAKLLDCSFRTVQNYMSAENWKEKRLKSQKPK